jgi:dolichol-phosphate mannosyltransferase
MPDYSIVIPVYFNEASLAPLMQSLDTNVLRANPQYQPEIIFVDDGSGDRSFLELKEIQARYPLIVTIIKLTRNFGQGAAMLAGWRQAKGKCLITMSADGQEPTEKINDMLKGFFEEAYDIVICARRGRDESLYRIVTSQIFFFLMRKLTFPDMPKEGFDFWLLSRRAFETILRNADVQPFFQGYTLWTGFKTKVLPYRRRERHSGVSRWTLGKKFTAFLDSVVLFSFAPIRVMSLMGCICAFLGFAYAIWIMRDTLVLGNPVKGWSPIMVAILVMGGFQMIMLGVMGEYLWRTLAQVRGREKYVIDAIYESTRAGNPAPGGDALISPTKAFSATNPAAADA